jgi:diacylglycerol kinase family enzyme
VALHGTPRLTDAFLINDLFACMLCGLGFDAQVARNFADDPRRGLSTYIRKTVEHFFTAKTYPFKLQSGNEQFETDAFFISIANSNQFGNNFTIAPKAKLNDGLLDIVIVTRQTKLGFLWNTLLQAGGFVPLQKKELSGNKGTVLYFQTEALKISNPQLAPLHIDGDPSESFEEMEIRVLKNYFRLSCP